MHPDSHTHTDAHTRTIHEEEMYLAVSTEQALSSRLDGDNCRVIIIFSFRLIAISASAILMHQPRKIDYLLLSYIKNDFYAPAICSQIVPPYSSAHPSYFVRPYFSFSLNLHWKHLHTSDRICIFHKKSRKTGPVCANAKKQNGASTHRQRVVDYRSLFACISALFFPIHALPIHLDLR